MNVVSVEILYSKNATNEPAGKNLQELLSTNNMVTISFVESLLKEAEIYHQVLDQNMSVLEGSIGIIPRRIMVEDAMIRHARALVEDAGIAYELKKS